MTNLQRTSNKKDRQQIMVHVKLSDFLSRIVSEAEFDVEINAGSTISDLISVLIEGLGAEFRKAIVDRNGKLHGGIAVILNKRFIPPQQIEEHTINQKSNLSIIPIAGGG